jgi:AmiR/NasT family two-component response regulator
VGDDAKYDDYTAADYRADIDDLADDNTRLTGENERLTSANLDLTSDNEDLTADNLRLTLQNEGLTAALGHRGVIGQAMGVLMERHKIKAEEAFDMLVAASQRQNVKLFVLAEQLARTGELP